MAFEYEDKIYEILDDAKVNSSDAEYDRILINTSSYLLALKDERALNKDIEAHEAG
jgi:hypothetical protein